MQGFYFSCPSTEEQYRSFSGMMKFNGGLFKSEKQASFLTKRVFNEVKTEEGAADAVKHYGISIKVGQFFFIAEAFMRWADYGSRSIIPIQYAFVADEFGIIAKYKIPCKGNLRDGASPDPTRTQLQWTRPDDVKLPEVKAKVEAEKAQAEAAKAASEFIGVPGKRVVFVGKVVAVRQFETSSRLHYYDTGMRVQTVVDVNGSTVIYWNALADAQKGDTVEFTATIKQHQVYKEVKQTVVSRASKVKISKEVV